MPVPEVGTPALQTIDSSKTFHVVHLSDSKYVYAHTVYVHAGQINLMDKNKETLLLKH